MNRIIRLIILFLVYSLQLLPEAIGQTCPVQAPILFGNPQPQFYNKNDFVVFGVFASQPTQDYKFTVESTSKGGPLIGNGGGLSVSAFMRSSGDAGEYRVTTSRPNCGSAYTQFYAYYNDIDNLSITAWGSNAVSFSWEHSGPNVLYEYTVTTEANPNSGAIIWDITWDNFASASGLQSGTTYYVHVRCKYASSPLGVVYPNNPVTRTLRFVSCSGNPPVGNILPRTMKLCNPPNGYPSSGFFTASGGTSYQWFRNGLQVPVTTPTITAYGDQPGIYGVEVTTSEGCSGLVYTSTLTSTFYQNPIITVKGKYCWGDSVRVGVSNTEVGVQYHVFDPSGQHIKTFAGIGRAIESGDTVWNSFLLTSPNQLGNCYVNTTNGCGIGASSGGNVSLAEPVTGLVTLAVNSTSVNFDWNGDSSEEFEYALTTTATPPAFGTPIIKYFPPWIYNLTPSTQYYIHVRPKCGQSSIPWTTISFTTAPLVANCGSPTTIGICTPVTSIITSGEGSWDFNGFYPDNSTGSVNPGRELIYSFTPTQDGVYYIDVTNVVTSIGSFSYLYKVAGSCTPTGWTGIATANSIGKYPIGMLTAGVTYWLLADNTDLAGGQQTFRICRATVASPSTFNTCITAIPFSAYMAPNKGKEEYIIDNNGRLIASIDFRNIPDYHSSTVEIGYYVNNAALRRDLYNREYLDRHFSVNINSSIPLPNIPVKLFFTNGELQRVINEPDDGIADVGNRSELHATFADWSCTGTVNSSFSQYYYPQRSNGDYDANSGYITVDKPDFNQNIYLHGGVAELGYYITPYSYESFDSVQLPKDWRQRFVNGTGTVSMQQSTVNPITTPFHGPRFAWWNSRSITSGSETRFITPPVKTTGYPGVALEFMWYNNNNAAANDGVQVEYSLDGNTWTAVGAFIPRHDAGAPASGQWTKKVLTLPAAAANKPYIYISFKLRSQQGENCGIDGVMVIQSTTCTLYANPITVNTVTSNSVTFSWPNVSTATGYEYVVSPYPGWPGGGAFTTNLTATVNNLTVSTDYYIHVRPRCASNTGGYYNTIKVTTNSSSSPNCSQAPQLYDCSPYFMNIPSGTGSWNFAGTYPYNSVGFATPGRERLFVFVPDETAVYYLNVTSSTGGYVDWFYQPYTSTCSNSNWTGIDRTNGPTKRAIGLLLKNQIYYFMVDNESVDAVSVNFAFCRADVVQYNPATCVTAIPITNIIPAGSTKEEFVLDEEGHVIAGFSFGGTPNSVGGISLSYYGKYYTPLRKNAQNMEYMNRNFSVHFDNPPGDDISVRFFFHSDELYMMWNEAGDCIGDVNFLDDLWLAYKSEACATQMTGTYNSSPSWLWGFVFNNGEWAKFTVPSNALNGSNTSFFVQGPPSNPPPAISPASVSLCWGSSQVLTVSGNGNTFRWFRNGVLIQGANASTLTVNQAGAYTVQVSNSSCTYPISNTVNVTVTPSTTISPSSAIICSGSSQLLTASGGQSYQWFRNGVPLGPFSPVNTYTATLTGTYTVTIVNGSCTMPGYNAATISVLSPPVSTTVHSVCSNQLPYIWNGNPYSATGIYDVVILLPNGCDSIARLNLTVRPIGTSTTNITRCSNQLPYVWNGNNYTTTGIYNVTLVAANGCDSIATLNLIVNQVSTSTSNVSICTNQVPYVWNGSSYSTTGVYNVTLTAANGCDSIATLNLVVSSVLTSTTNETICSNLLPYSWNGNSYTGPGTFSVTLTSQSGCDSIATLNLVVNPVLTSTTPVTVCTNQLPFTWNGNSYSTAGSFTVTLAGTNGCDSLATLELTINPTASSITNESVCANQLPFNWNGNSYSTAGSFQVTLTAANGCDSIATLNLAIKPVSSSTTPITICTNQLPFTWNGNIFNAAGTYPVTLTGSNGCDSIATLVLTVNTVVTSTTSVSICPNQLPYSWNNNSYPAGGTFVVTLVSSSGCDSLATLILTVNPVTTSTTNVTVCNNQLPYSWNGNNYSNTGVFTVTLVNSNGCDSIATLNLVVNAVTSSTNPVSICDNQLPFNWNGNQYNSSGTYQVTLVNQAGCDSVATLVLSVNPVLTSTTNETICAAQLPYTWNGNQYTAAGTYQVTLISSANCDSIATLVLVVNNVVTSTTLESVCENNLPFIWNGNSYNASGTYQVTLVSQAGCDSVATLQLEVKPVRTSISNHSVCENQLPFIWNGNSYPNAGTFQVTLPGSNGCDSIATLQLSVLPVTSSVTNHTICDNQLPFIWNGNSYSTAGSFTVTLTGSTGCDSLATLNLTVNPVTFSTTSESVCNNHLPFVWNGNSYINSGTFIVTLINSNGCDSVATLQLTVLPISTSTTNDEVCTNQLPYVWNGNSYNNTGTYVVTLSGSNGCDSVATLNLVVKPVLTSTTNETVCSNNLPFIWNNNSYNAAGTYTVTLTGSNGCDSLATLNLTVKAVSASTTNADVCNNQLPFIWNGNQYNASGTYTVTLIGSNGCDSIATLQLVVKPVLTSITNAAVCTSQLPFAWNGNQYNAAGTYNVTLTGSNNCDSIATLVLIVKPSSASTTATDICADALPYSWNGNLYNAAGTYQVILIGANGCDSTATLILTVRPLPSGSIAPATATICAGSTQQFTVSGGTSYQWFRNGTPVPGGTGATLTASLPGNYTVQINGANGCTAMSANQATLTVLEKPVADFSNSSVCQDEVTTFINNSQTTGSGSVNFNWDFGDNANSTQVSPTHTYALDGVFNVTLIATPVTCPALADTLIKSITVTKATKGLRYDPVRVVMNSPTMLTARDIGQQFAWTPVTGLSNPSLRMPVVTTSTEREYLINITTPAGCKVMDTVLVQVFAKAEVFVPKGFTPNGNNTNDVLRPVCVGIVSIDYFRVYNRWGQLVYQTQTPGEGWNGNFKNQPQPTETYTWIFQGKAADGTTIKATGKTVLIR